MTTEEAMFAAVLADPDDKLPRLVLCDLWEENGRPEFAQECRRQIVCDTAASSGPIHPRFAPYYSVAPFSPRPRSADGSSVLFWGGLPDVARMSAEVFRSLRLTDFARLPIRRIELADAHTSVTLRRVCREIGLHVVRAGVELRGVVVPRPLYLPGLSETRYEAVTIRERRVLAAESRSWDTAGEAREDVLRMAQLHPHVTEVPNTDPMIDPQTARMLRGYLDGPVVLPPAHILGTPPA